MVMSKSIKGLADKPDNAKTNQAWGGRFNEPVDDFVARFTASVNFDQRLYQHASNRVSSSSAPTIGRLSTKSGSLATPWAIKFTAS